MRQHGRGNGHGLLDKTHQDTTKYQSRKAPIDNQPVRQCRTDKGHVQKRLSLQQLGVGENSHQNTSHDLRRRKQRRQPFSLTGAVDSGLLVVLKEKGDDQGHGKHVNQDQQWECDSGREGPSALCACA
eukprot:scaffold36052_cov206-Amphora_coffeaeformis.AAC.1